MIIYLTLKDTLDIIDIPGHPKLRLFENHIPLTQKIIFFIDATNPSLSTASEYLFDVLTMPYRTFPKMLIACHKSDELLAQPKFKIKASLEKELYVIG